MAAAASAMVEGGEGEVQGANGGVQGLGGATWRSSSSSKGEAASRWRRGELAHAGVTSLSALAGGSSGLAMGQHSAGPPGGLPGKFLLCFLFFFLFVSVLCFEIVEILFHLGKS